MFAVQDIERALVEFFERVARKDEAELARLKGAADFHVDAASWRFSLPALHAFLQYHESALREVDYKQFRQVLFKSPVNQRLQGLGAEIVIAENRSKVDQSTYALVWQRT